MDQQGIFDSSVTNLIERKVTSWLRGVITEMRRSSPVQQWLDSLPAEESGDDKGNEEVDPESKQEESKDTTTDEITVCEKTLAAYPPTPEHTLEVPNHVEVLKRKSLDGNMHLNATTADGKKKLQRDYSIQSEGQPMRMRNPLFRDGSLQSDASGSSGSSVLNVLGARKVDAESVLIALGFGPSEKQQRLQRIPERFLGPSKMRGISTEQFIREEQHSMRLHDCGVFGYRGLTGSPHVPPSSIVAKIMDRIVHEDAARAPALGLQRHSVADIASARAQLAARLRYT